MKVFIKHENKYQGKPYKLSVGTTYLVHHIMQTQYPQTLKLLISNDSNELVLVDYNLFRTPPRLPNQHER